MNAAKPFTIEIKRNGHRAVIKDKAKLGPRTAELAAAEEAENLLDETVLATIKTSLLKS